MIGKRFSTVWCAGIVSLLCANTSMGLDTVWQHDPNTSGNWYTDANWTLNAPFVADNPFINNGGTADVSDPNGHAVGDFLTIGQNAGDDGTVTLSDGKMTIHAYVVGDAGNGLIQQTGGDANGTGIFLGNGATGVGQYDLGGGSMDIQSFINVGQFGDGTFNHSAGSATTEAVFLGFGASSDGTYEMTGPGASLTVDAIYVGYGSTGEFTMSDGTVDAALWTAMGFSPGSSGSFTIGGGQYTGDVSVGFHGHGELHLTNAAAQITVPTLIQFGTDSVLTAVTGTTVNLPGGAIDILSTDPVALGGSSELNLVADGDNTVVSLIEAAGEDLGPAMGGFVTNFAFAGLDVATPDSLAQLRNATDNQPASAPADALYVKELMLGSGSILDLNGISLYTLNFTDNGGAVLNGAVNLVVMGDLDGDGLVGATDLGLLGNQWGTPGGGGGAPNADANGDGTVDVIDLGIVAAGWTPPPPGLSSTTLGTASVPAPAALSLGLILFGTIGSRRRR